MRMSLMIFMKYIFFYCSMKTYVVTCLIFVLSFKKISQRVSDFILSGCNLFTGA